jgi:hypothetical protein
VNRRLGAALAGFLTGATGLAIMLLLGWLLYQRLFGDSGPALVVIFVLFGVVGLYAGWLLGLVVFSAVLGSEEGEETTT